MTAACSFSWMATRRVISVALLTLVGVLGCASVPLSTMVKMSQFGPEEFVELKPEDIRAKVTVEEAVGLKPEQTILEVTLASPNGQLMKTFNFELISETPRTEERWLRAPLHWIDYEMKLTDEGESAFKSFQQFAANDPELNSFAISVGAKVKNPPPEGEIMVMSIALKLYQQEAYMPLFEKAEIKMGKTEI
ncbi:hypothetical protein [Corallincola spongiicola]|uniref:Uncharacterized protein n=1 Tax=Corallincola spongiicola TaxID=2520508 RepID=A0ABY1WQL6_9GAMM|nr:hypothetical protein [Corallincola spongiicola]TAA46925.1 hypothetical protein EXY25_06615 [Corallincola spongiicola]